MSPSTHYCLFRNSEMSNSLSAWGTNVQVPSHIQCIKLQADVTEQIHIASLHPSCDHIYPHNNGTDTVHFIVSFFIFLCPIGFVMILTIFKQIWISLISIMETWCTAYSQTLHSFKEQFAKYCHVSLPRLVCDRSIIEFQNEKADTVSSSFTD